MSDMEKHTTHSGLSRKHRMQFKFVDSHILEKLIFFQRSIYEYIFSQRNFFLDYTLKIEHGKM